MQNLAVVYFPRVSIEEINVFRQKYDPGWNIINPHITLVFPISDISENQLFEHIEIITKEIKCFPIVLSELIKSFDNYLFLQVKEGNEKIADVHKKLYSGMLTPHLQTDIPFIPHITLGYFNTADNIFNKKLYEKAYEEAISMNIQITCNFDNITLIKGDGMSPAKIIKTFKLRK